MPWIVDQSFEVKGLILNIDGCAYVTWQELIAVYLQTRAIHPCVYVLLACALTAAANHL